ncbi:MAG: acyltransferase [Chitinophagaceae bacterium]|nr:acyltransferase [Chitinophagaceae bacterium]
MTHFLRPQNNQPIIQEIDGLRCIAIVAVVISHLNLQIIRLSNLPEDFVYSNSVALFIELCGNGVSIFFCISAFILSIPFIKYYLYNGEKVKLQQYYWKRVKRLEIPYLLVLIVLLLFRILVQGEFWKAEMPHFFSSFFYSHNIIYGRRSTINPVAWTLEIEIQFYILLPLIIQLFRIKTTIVRRLIIVCLLVASGIIYAANDAFFIDAHLQYSIIPYLSIFLLGILMADVYLSNQQVLNSKNFLFDIGGILAFLLIIYNAGASELHIQVLEYIGYVLFFVGVFKGKLLNQIFTQKWVMAIGCMCYSIYLLHYALLYFITEKLTAQLLVSSYYKNLLIQGIVVLPMVLIGCSIFYWVVEKPLMKRRAK